MHILRACHCCVPSIYHSAWYIGHAYMKLAECMGTPFCLPIMAKKVSGYSLVVRHSYTESRVAVRCILPSHMRPSSHAALVHLRQTLMLIGVNMLLGHH